MLSGALSDWMIARRVRIVTVRKIMTSIGACCVRANAFRLAASNQYNSCLVCAALFGPALSLVLLKSKAQASCQSGCDR